MFGGVPEDVLTWLPLDTDTDTHGGESHDLAGVALSEWLNGWQGFALGFKDILDHYIARVFSPEDLTVEGAMGMPLHLGARQRGQVHVLADDMGLLAHGTQRQIIDSHRDNRKNEELVVHAQAPSENVWRENFKSKA